MRREKASVWETVAPTQEKICDFLRNIATATRPNQQDTATVGASGDIGVLASIRCGSS